MSITAWTNVLRDKRTPQRRKGAKKDDVSLHLVPTLLRRYNESDAPASCHCLNTEKLGAGRGVWKRVGSWENTAQVVRKRKTPGKTLSQRFCVFAVSLLKHEHY